MRASDRVEPNWFPSSFFLSFVQFYLSPQFYFLSRSSPRFPKPSYNSIKIILAQKNDWYFLHKMKTLLSYEYIWWSSTKSLLVIFLQNLNLLEKQMCFHQVCLCRLEYFPSVSKKMHIIDYQRKTLFFVCNIWKLYNFFLGIPRINGLRYYLNPSISIRKFKFNSSFHSLNIFQRWENDFEFLPFYFSLEF